MGTSAIADKEAMLAALAQIEELTAHMNGLSVDAFTPLELMELQQRRETVAWMQPNLDHKVYQRPTSQSTPKQLGATSFKKALAARLRISEADAARRLKNATLLGPRTALTGEPLEPALPNVAAAQAEGLIGPEHVATVKKFLKKLPASVDFSAREAAEADLARHASNLDVAAFIEVADRLKYLLNQDGEFSDADRQANRYVTIGKQDADGMVPVRGKLTPECAAALEAVQAKLAAPGMCNPADDAPQVDGEPDPERATTDARTQGQRNHDALLAMCRALLASGDLGQHNGLPVTIIVKVNLTDLEKGVGHGLTAGGTLIPIPDVIRMASHAFHYLALFDGQGVPLHLGRARRTATRGQRIMLLAQHGGCTMPGCTACGYRCQAHHANKDWKAGGDTNIEDLTLACGPDTGWSRPPAGPPETAPKMGSPSGFRHRSWTAGSPASMCITTRTGSSPPTTTRKRLVDSAARQVTPCRARRGADRSTRTVSAPSG